MAAIIIVGAQWGDEGKGKATDILGGKVDYVVKPNGGNNAGHTVVVGGEKYELKLLPAGVLSENATPVLGNGVVINLEALFEEIDTRDLERAKAVYASAVAAVPHRAFTFAKLWLAYAYFEIRRRDVQLARKILGTAIGLAPKHKLFTGYIQLELELKEFDRVRKLYEKALEWDASSAATWVQFAELEQNLFDLERARAIYELAIEQAEADVEWVLRPYMNTAKKRSQLSAP